MARRRRRARQERQRQEFDFEMWVGIGFIIAAFALIVAQTFGGVGHV